MITNKKLRFAEDDEKLSVAEKKGRLRIFMKQKRSLTENRDVKERLRNENFFRAVFDETEGAGTRRTFFVYLSFSAEAPTDRLIEALIERGQTVCCPRLESLENGETENMTAVLFGEDFSLTDRGIREPVGQAYTGNIDVVVAPLLAVDENGNRLGYGKGCYDRFLKEYPSAKRVAYCYDFQIANAVPVEDGDEKMDVIVTEERILHVTK